MQICSLSPLLGLLVIFSRASAYFGYGVMRCQFSSREDAVYLGQLYFNKMLLAEYNGTLGKYIGYTEKAKEIAEELNKKHAFMKEVKKLEERCSNHIPMMLDFLSKPVEPSVRLRSVKSESSSHPAVLICSVYNFYPKQIRVTWLRNGKETTSAVTSSEELPNGNWLYQLHSHLEYTPRLGEKISCKVEHTSLAEPQLHEWDPTPVAERNKIATGAAGLLLGLVFFGAGLIYCKRNTTGRVLVPTS